MAKIFSTTKGKAFINMMANFSQYEVYELKNNLGNCLIRYKELDLSILVIAKFAKFKHNTKSYKFDSIGCYSNILIFASIVENNNVTKIRMLYGNQIIKENKNSKWIKPSDFFDWQTVPNFLEGIFRANNPQVHFYNRNEVAEIIDKDEFNFNPIIFAFDFFNSHGDYICEKPSKQIYSHLCLKHKNFPFSFPVLTFSSVFNDNGKYQFKRERKIEKGLLVIGLAFNTNRKDILGYKIFENVEGTGWLSLSEMNNKETFFVNLRKVFLDYSNGSNPYQLDNLNKDQINSIVVKRKGSDNRYYSSETETISRLIFQKLNELDGRFEIIDLPGNCRTDILIKLKNNDRIIINIQLKSSSVNTRDSNSYQFNKCNKYPKTLMVFIALNHEITKTIGIIVELGKDITSINKSYTINKFQLPNTIFNKIEAYFNEFDPDYLTHPHLVNTTKIIEENRVCPAELIEKLIIESFNRICFFLIIERSPQFSIYDYKTMFCNVLFKTQVKTILKRHDISYEIFSSKLGKSYNSKKTFYELRDDIDIFHFIYDTPDEKFSYIFTKWELYKICKLSYEKADNNIEKSALFTFYPPSFYRNPQREYSYLWTDIGYVDYNRSDLQNFIYKKMLKSYSERRLIEEEIENHARPEYSEELRVKVSQELIAECIEWNNKPREDYESIIELMQEDIRNDSYIAKDREKKIIIDDYPYENPEENIKRKKERDRLKEEEENLANIRQISLNTSPAIEFFIPSDASNTSQISLNTSPAIKFFIPDASNTRQISLNTPSAIEFFIPDASNTSQTSLNTSPAIEFFIPDASKK